MVGLAADPPPDLRLAPADAPASLRRSAVFSAEIQARPAGSRSARIRAVPGADLLHLGRHRGRIPGVVGKQLHRAAPGTTQQTEDDLLLAVPVVAKGGQRTTPPLQVGTRHVVEDQGPILQVPPGQGPLDPWLAPDQPVQHVQQFIAADRGEFEQGAGTAGGGLRRQAPRGGQPGVREQDPGDAALEDGAEPLDDLGGQPGEVGDGLLADSGTFAPGLTQEDGGLAGLVGHEFDVEGQGAISVIGTYIHYSSEYVEPQMKSINWVNHRLVKLLM